MFTRRVSLSTEECEASRAYIDACLADKENKETIVPAGAWAELRPDKEVIYIDGKRRVCRVLHCIAGAGGGVASPVVFTIW